MISWLFSCGLVFCGGGITQHYSVFLESIFGFSFAIMSYFSEKTHWIYYLQIFDAINDPICQMTMQNGKADAIFYKNVRSEWKLTENSLQFSKSLDLIKNWFLLLRQHLWQYCAIPEKSLEWFQVFDNQWKMFCRLL